MGVHELWKLLAAAGRTIDLNSLKGTSAAIDVSIWMIKILHGMSKAGVEFQNVHIIGIMKRIIQLLRLGVKPVFVFDGPPPELKRQCISQRNAQRKLHGRNLQKIAERYVVKLMEKGVDLQTINEKEESEDVQMDEVDFKDSELDPEEQEILHQQEHEILNLQYDQLGGTNPAFQSLDLETKQELVDSLLQERGIIEDSNITWKKFLAKAEFNEKVREIRREAKREIEKIRISKILDDQNDEQSKLLREYLENDEELVVKMGQFGINNIYVYLQDENKRKELIELLKKNQRQEKKKKRKQKLKDFQLENQHFAKVRQVIKRRYENQLEEEQEEVQYQVEQVEDNLLDKYEIYDLDLLAQKLENDTKSNPPSKSPSIYNVKESLTQKQPQLFQKIIEEDEFQDEIDQNQYGESKVKGSEKYESEENESEEQEQNQMNIIEEYQQIQKQSQKQQQLQSENPIQFQQIEKFDQSPQKNNQNKSVSGDSEIEIPISKETPKNQKPSAQKKATQQEIDDLLDNLDNQEDIEQLSAEELLDRLKVNQNLQALSFGSLTDRFEEIRHLLSLFGIPWVMAPGEAEAQCAYLQQQGLVDFVITEDSDVFLFGATRVIKGLFEQSGNLHYYDMKYIKEDLGLSRDQLIYLALFLGSDYTLGIRGVGIVNAMEIVEVFDSIEALKRFAEWASKPDQLLVNAESHYEAVPEKERHYKELHRNYKKYWELPSDFPSQIVVQGYLDPSVDNSKEMFTWAEPAVDKIIELCRNVLIF